MSTPLLVKGAEDQYTEPMARRKAAENQIVKTLPVESLYSSASPQLKEEVKDARDNFLRRVSDNLDILFTHAWDLATGVYVEETDGEERRVYREKPDRSMLTFLIEHGIGKPGRRADDEDKSRAQGLEFLLKRVIEERKREQESTPLKAPAPILTIGTPVSSPESVLSRLNRS